MDIWTTARKQKSGTDTMLFPFVLLAVSTVRFMHRRSLLSSGIVFPEDLQTWCPYTKFCQADQPQESTTPDPNITSTMVHCCEDCSCSPDCGLTRSCCTSEHDQYKIDETLGTICKSLNNRDDASPRDVMYHIVDKCPNKEEGCSSLNVSTWGSFSPVYSRSTGMIYYNYHCAECHGQLDVTNFAPIISFHFLPGIYSKSISKALSGLNDEAHLEFIPLRDIDLSTQVCYAFMIRDCQDPDPERYYLKERCSSFNATFHKGFNAYQNIYCYICSKYNLVVSSNWLQNNVYCPASLPMKHFGQSSLIVLLDEDSIDNYQKSKMEQEGVPNKCIKDMTSSTSQVCRPVLCPQAHFRVRNRCVLYGQNWYVRNVKVTVKLTPSDDNNSPLMVSDLAKLTKKEFESREKRFMQRPRMQDWELDLFYNVHNNETTVRFVMATVSMGSRTTNAKRLLDDIKTSLQSDWTLSINGNEFKLQPSFNKFIRYDVMYPNVVPTDDKLRVNGALAFVPSSMRADSPRIEQFRVMNLTRVSVSVDPYHLFTLQITKMFFCEQIALHTNEYERFSIDEVYIIDKQTYLGSGEFVDSTTQSDLSTELRICLHDMFDVSAAHAHKCAALFLLPCLIVLQYSVRQIRIFIT